jgi:hypothetical protein
MHIIRGGLNYNMELRWDGVPSLADAMAMLKKQVDNTPAPQWVRVVGGFTEHQFAEKRLPTIDEINAVAPDTPVFILHLYDRALLNAAALRVVGYTRDTPNPPGGEIVRDAAGNPTGLLLAQPNATILYATLAKGPKLSPDYQLNSTRHFMREMNGLGVTGVIDAGGGFQNYPDDYAIIEKLHADGELTVRISYNLFTQKPKEELKDFATGRSRSSPARATTPIATMARARCWSIRPPTSRISASSDPKCRRTWRPISNRSSACSPSGAGRGGSTPPITRRSAARSTSMRRSTATSRSTACTGSSTMPRRSASATSIGSPPLAAASPSSTAWPIRANISSSAMAQGRRGDPADQADDGLRHPVGAGTDATRVASYNPWVSLSWLVTGKTVGGLNLYPVANRIDRETALRLWTERQYLVLERGRQEGADQGRASSPIWRCSRTIISRPRERDRPAGSVLTLLGGKVVYGAGDYAPLAPALPRPMPDWSPVATFGGYWRSPETKAKLASACGCEGSCAVHGHDHAAALGAAVPAKDVRSFWGVMGCGCWAV